jgi:hypothetical protein
MIYTSNTHEKVNLRPYEKYVLESVNTKENKKRRLMLYKDFSYRIS